MLGILITTVLTCLRIKIYNAEVAAEQNQLAEAGINFKMYGMSEPPDLIVLIILLATFTVTFYLVKKISHSVVFTISVLLFMILNSHFWVDTVEIFVYSKTLHSLGQQGTVQSKLLVGIVETIFIFPLALIQTYLLFRFIKNRHHARIYLK